MKFASFCFLICSQLAIVTLAQDIQGTWQTSIPDHGRDLRYVVHIMKTNGAIAATLDVPEHFQFGEPADSILFNAPVVNFRS